ncbi:GNAT family N-acetyltransferase [Allomuricauda sp. ARW1Y1]|jgi:GNAT superfamily N-acetyltransferase|uniref:GNAT family N-acetyltransferase n=1 Tax=Allomuricauda sp. ARW1Y1 TaxID=2663843 RepID=UPI0015C9920F|nr:GNAT family N-acetyltransferase [Muricauda sp. ARW1Y1]NYJ26746.1 GNAT superfamily N-acetyltransferase [Muricauda sp. ARW1Y1]
MVIKTYDAYTRLSTMEADRFANFLFDHQEGKKATKKAIRKAIQYSTKDIPGLGGYVFAMEEKDDILGLAVVNKTGMGDYIPENFLVFFVIHRDHRKNDIEKKLLDYTLQYCKGDVAVHITGENQYPNKEFFEEKGFKATHLEMRLNR